ncbi:MAG: site-specific integrase [Ktedonobacteraceae bacterium]|nr:site-specific integrase [Ktedonobacteraceae bacterium]
MVKRDYGDGSVYRRKSDGRFVATLRADGKRLYFYGDTRAEALQKLKKAQREYEMGSLALSGAKLTVRQYLAYWSDIHGAYKKAHTRSNIAKACKRVDPFIGHLKLQKLTGDHLQHMYGIWQKEGLSPNTIRLIHVILSTAFKQAIKWKRMSSNPCKDVTLPKAVKHAHVCLTPEQAQQLIQTAREHPLECLLVLAVTTGLRKGELLGLRWSDIDLEKQTLQVARTVSYIAMDGKSYSFIETGPKTEQSRRTIQIPQFAIEHLRLHRAKQLQRRHQAGGAWNDQDLVFPGTLGTHYRPPTLQRHFTALLNRAGLPRMRFHDLRHSAATILLSFGVNAKVIQELLGHSNIQTTLNLYSHVLPGMQKEAMSYLDRLYQQAE